MTLRLSLRDLYAAAFTEGLARKAERPRERLCAWCRAPLPQDRRMDLTCSDECHAEYADARAW